MYQMLVRSFWQHPQLYLVPTCHTCDFTWARFPPDYDVTKAKVARESPEGLDGNISLRAYPHICGEELAVERDGCRKGLVTPGRRLEVAPLVVPPRRQCELDRCPVLVERQVSH
jgi:hypothetical protein